jgi:hypothetical protein
MFHLLTLPTTTYFHKLTGANVRRTFTKKFLVYKTVCFRFHPMFTERSRSPNVRASQLMKVRSSIFTQLILVVNFYENSNLNYKKMVLNNLLIYLESRVSLYL